jgi:formamidopyrimidine-DNA glycosylase
VPELPEVETMVRGVRPALVGQQILAASLSHTDILRGVTRPRLLAALTGATIREVSRRAKHAVLDLGDRRLVLQMGMTGNLLYYNRPLSEAERRYAVLRAQLSNGIEFVFRDVRRIGTILLLDQPGWSRYTEALGPEPLDERFGETAFAEQLRHSRQAIKKVLMDQRKVVGVGNIYANEALFAAGIRPSRQARRVTRREYGRLFEEVRRILRAAIEAGGSTIRDYRTGTGEIGEFQHEFLVYDREGEPCASCGGTLIGTHRIDGRQTVYCRACQR